MYREQAAILIQEERDRQDEKWGKENNYTLAKMLLILMEEVGELSQALLNAPLYESFDKNVMDEAIQVAGTGAKLLEHALRCRDDDLRLKWE